MGALIGPAVLLDSICLGFRKSLDLAFTPGLDLRFSLCLELVLRFVLKHGLDGASGEALADEAARLLVGRKVLEGRQLADAPQAKVLEEQARRAPELCLAAVGGAAHLAHEALLAQRGDDAVGVDAADGADALARDGLVVGDDGERLERGLREAPRVPAHHVVSHLVVVGGVGEQAPAARDLAQLEAAVGVGVLGGELGERRGHLPGRGAGGAREVGGGHGVVGDEQQGLEQALQRAGVQASQVVHVRSSPSSCASAAATASSSPSSPKSSRSSARTESSSS